MANFKTTGINGLILSMSEIAELPENLKEGILDVESGVSILAMRKILADMKLIDTGELSRSLRVMQKIGYRYIIPYGERENAKKRRLVRRKKGLIVGYKRGKMENNDVGFVLEFGAPRRGIPAFEWMRTALELSDDEATDAAMTLYDNWLQSKNL